MERFSLRKICLLITLISGLSQFAVYGRDSYGRSDTLAVNVYFRQARSNMDLDFRDNSSNLTDFINKVNALNADASALIHSVNISTGASPEGSYEFNERISMERAHTIRDYILNNTTLAASQIKVRSTGVDWDGFEEMVSRGDDPARDTILSIIRLQNTIETTDGRTVDKRIAMLKALDGGSVWKRLNDGLFNDLRQAGGKVTCIVSSMDGVGMTFEHRNDTLVIIHRDTVYNYICSQVISSDVKKSKPSRGFRRDSLFNIPVVAIRSNLFVPLMNIGVEVSLSNRLSVEGDLYSPWLMRRWIDTHLPSHRYCFQLVGGTIGCRFWTGTRHDRKVGDPRYRLRGHSFAVVVSGGVYDFEWDWKGQQGEYAVAGVDYLYGLPLGRGGAHMEFNIGVGCGVNWYNNYVVHYEGGHLTDDGGHQHRFIIVPIRVGISIAVPICREYKKEI